MSQFLFKGDVAHLHDPIWTDRIEANLVAWLSWALLGAGGFENVSRGQVAPHGAADRSRLRAADDPRYASGTRWQAHRGDWCWESGISYHSQPIQVSGIWVNSQFFSTASTTGQYAHYVDYARGQVVFATGVPATSVVQAAYSPRTVQVRRADEPWFHQGVFNSFRADSTAFTAPSASGGGAYAVFAENRVQFPCVVVEPTFEGSFAPYEMGGSAGVYGVWFTLHVLAETPWDRKRLHDILFKQADKRVSTFDPTTAPMPLDAQGKIVPSALTYPALCSGHPWQPLLITEARSLASPPLGQRLYPAAVRWKIETILS